jgi:uncharacterized protein YPO0396
VSEYRAVQALIVVDLQSAFVSGPGAVPTAGELVATVDDLSWRACWRGRGLAELVPHAMVSRVAEWALSDEIDVIANATDIRFVS